MGGKEGLSKKDKDERDWTLEAEEWERCLRLPDLCQDRTFPTLKRGRDWRGQNPGLAQAGSGWGFPEMPIGTHRLVPLLLPSPKAETKAKGEGIFQLCYL